MIQSWVTYYQVIIEGQNAIDKKHKSGKFCNKNYKIQNLSATRNLEKNWIACNPTRKYLSQ